MWQRRMTDSFVTSCCLQLNPPRLLHYSVRVAIDIRRITEFGVGTYTRNAIRTLARLDH